MTGIAERERHRHRSRRRRRPGRHDRQDRLRRPRHRRLLHRRRTRLVHHRPTTALTYCFEITNTGDTHLSITTIDDTDLGIDGNDLTLLSGNPILLAPGATTIGYYQTNGTGDLLNTVNLAANPIASDGTDLTGIADVTDTDTARVDEVAPDISIDKTVYTGHDAGASCDGDELVTTLSGDDVTYCFTITNTGDTHLDTLVDQRPRSRHRPDRPGPPLGRPDPGRPRRHRHLVLRRHHHHRPHQHRKCLGQPHHPRRHRHDRHRERERLRHRSRRRRRPGRHDRQDRLRRPRHRRLLHRRRTRLVHHRPTTPSPTASRSPTPATPTSASPPSTTPTSASTATTSPSSPATPSSSPPAPPPSATTRPTAPATSSTPSTSPPTPSPPTAPT